MSSDVEFSVHGGVGRITLNRPKARNALTTGMVIAIKEQLDAWDLDPAIRAAVVIGAGDHGLCAGGDVRDMQASAIRGDDGAAEFFRAEYRMNARIHQFSKPYMSIMDGLAMGGGIGVSAHGSVRIVTERSLLAMPEVTIGICVDVGATWLLSRAPGQVGTYLALTGGTFGPGDAIYCGFADYFMPVADLANFLHRLETESIDSLLAQLCRGQQRIRVGLQGRVRVRGGARSSGAVVARQGGQRRGGRNGGRKPRAATRARAPRSSPGSARVRPSCCQASGARGAFRARGPRRA